MSDKPIRYGMVIDQRRCVGCHACVIACKLENNMPMKESLNVVITEGSEVLDQPAGNTPLPDRGTLAMFNREAGTMRMDYLTRACQHCVDAPCVARCPVEATWQRKDGIVMMEPAKCINCALCMHDCTYGYGTMRLLITEPVFEPVFELGDQSAEPTLDNTVKKCTLCAHRVDRGELPACVDACPSRARFFGDLNDTGSEVYTKRNRFRIKQLEAEQGRQGTESSIYFIEAVQ